MNATQNNPARTGNPQSLQTRPEQAHKSENTQTCEKLAREEREKPRGKNVQNQTQSFSSLRNQSARGTRHINRPLGIFGPMVRKPDHGTLKRAGGHIRPPICHGVQCRTTVQHQRRDTLAANATQGGVNIRNQNELFTECHHDDEHTERFPHRQRKSFRLTETKFADRIPLMTETIQDRLKRLIAETGKSIQSVSKEADLDKETLRKLLKNPNQKPTLRTVEGLARALNVSQNYILEGTSEIDQGSTNQPITESTPASNQASPLMLMDVPVMGTAAGSLMRGAFKVINGPVDYVRRPPSLATARDIYALYVEGSSMEPQFFPGELIYLNPHRPAKQGDIVVVQCRTNSDSDVEASLGIYLRTTEKHVIIGKRNPQAEVQLPRESVSNVHRVLNINELLAT